MRTKVVEHMKSCLVFVAVICIGVAWAQPVVTELAAENREVPGALELKGIQKRLGLDLCKRLPFPSRGASYPGAPLGLTPEALDEFLSNSSTRKCWGAAVVYYAYFGGSYSVMQSIRFVESNFDGEVGFSDFVTAGEGLNALGLFVRLNPNDPAASLALDYLVSATSSAFWANGRIKWSVASVSKELLVYFLRRRAIDGLGLTGDSRARAHLNAIRRLNEHLENRDSIDGALRRLHYLRRGQ